MELLIRVILISLAFTPIFGQTPSFHDQILALYSGPPRQPAVTDQPQRAAQLREFWAGALKEPDTFLPAIREELNDPTNPPFLFYDAALRLLNVSDRPEDRQLAFRSLAHCDVSDIDPSIYVNILNHWAALGENTTEAAFQTLKLKPFTAFFDEGRIRLGPDFALLSMLLPTKLEYWVEPAIARLSQETQDAVQKLLLFVLWYAQTDRADAAIRAFTVKRTTSPAIRAFGEGLLLRRARFTQLEFADIGAKSEATLREERRQLWVSVNAQNLSSNEIATIRLAVKRHPELNSVPASAGKE